MSVNELKTVNAAKIYLEKGFLDYRIYFMNLVTTDIVEGNSEKNRRTLEKLVEIREKRNNNVPDLFRHVESAYEKIIQK